MPTTTATTTVHRSELTVPADLHAEALELAQRVTHQIRTPLPVAPLPVPAVEAGEYEPQSWVAPPIRPGRRSDL